MKIDIWGVRIEVSVPKSEEEVKMTGFYNLVPVAKVGDWELCKQTLYRKVSKNVTQVYHQAGHVIVHAKCDVLTTSGSNGPVCIQCNQEMSYDEVCQMDMIMMKLSYV